MLIFPPSQKGDRVKLSRTRLRSQCLFDTSPGVCTYVKATVDGKLAAHVFACRWLYKGDKTGAEQGTICWITQLVVDRNYRERGLASMLLYTLKQDDDSMYGVASSHPATCLATANIFSSKPLLHFLLV